MSDFLPLFSISFSKSTDMVKEKCEGKNFCELEAANEMYGNPCEQTHKYLEVNFHCQAGKNISKFFFVLYVGQLVVDSVIMLHGHVC